MVYIYCLQLPFFLFSCMLLPPVQLAQARRDSMNHDGHDVMYPLIQTLPSERISGCATISTQAYAVHLVRFAHRPMVVWEHHCLPS